MSMLYTLDRELTKRFPNRRIAIDPNEAKSIFYSVIGEDSTDQFITGYLKDKGYTISTPGDIPEEDVTIVVEEPEVEKPVINEDDHTASDSLEVEVEVEVEEFDLDSFMESDFFTEEFKKPLAIQDYEENIALFKDNKVLSLEVKEKILLNNISLVHKVADRYSGMHRGVLDFEDLVNEGVFGLIKAIDKFDVSLGYQFSTYAYNWIRQSITRAIADKSLLVRLPVHLHQKLNKINSVERSYFEKYNVLDVKEIAAECEVSEEQYLQYKTIEHNFRHFTSLNTPMLDEGDEDILSMIDRSKSLWGNERQDPTNPEVPAYANVLREELDTIFLNLTEREAEVLKLRFGMEDDREHTLEEVGAILGVTRERIRQIQQKALSKMRNPSRKKQLDQFIAD